MSQWGWIFLCVGFLTAYVLTWYSALKFEKASVVASILVLASPLTTLLNSIYSGNNLEVINILGVLISIVGVSLFVAFSNKTEVISGNKNVKTI